LIFVILLDFDDNLLHITFLFTINKKLNSFK